MNANLEKLLKISNTLHKLQLEIQDAVEHEYVKLSEGQLDSLIEEYPGALEIQSTEDLERGLNNYFDYLARKLTLEYRQEIAQRVEMLLQENVDVVNSYRQSDNRSKLKEKNYNLVKNYLLQNWSEGVKLTYIDDCMVKELGLSLRCVQEHRKDFFRESL